MQIIKVSFRVKIFNSSHLKCVGTKSTTAPLNMDTQSPGSITNNMKLTTMPIGSISQCRITPQIADTVNSKMIVRFRPNGFIMEPNTK